MKIKEIVGFVGYTYFAKYLPSSDARVIGKLCRKTRGMFAKMFIFSGGGYKHSAQCNLPERA